MQNFKIIVLACFAYMPTVAQGVHVKAFAPFIKEGSKVVISLEYPYPGVFNYADKRIITSIEKSRFNFYFKLQAPELIRIQITAGGKNLSTLLFLEPGKIQLIFDDSTLKKKRLIHSQAQRDYQQFADRLAKTPEQKAYNYFLNSFSSTTVTQDSNARARLDSLKKQRDQSVTVAAKGWISENKLSGINAFIVHRYLYGKLPDSVVNRLFSAIPEKNRRNSWGREVHYFLENLSIGKKLPSLAMADISGEQVSLEKFSGKYVLVDFWASWCRPCRAENRTIYQLYDRYKDLGFEVVSVSLDENGSLWKEAIREDGMSWVNISDLKGWSGKIAGAFNIKELPCNYLLDKEGKILAKNVHGQDLHDLVTSLFE